MLAARLDRKIVFERETTSRNAIGTPEETYAFLKGKYATVSYSTGRTYGDSFAERTSTDAVFTIRYDQDVNYKCRILYNGSYYVIRHIETLGRKESMRILTQLLEINPSDG